MNVNNIHFTIFSLFILFLMTSKKFLLHIIHTLIQFNQFNCYFSSFHTICFYILYVDFVRIWSISEIVTRVPFFLSVNNETISLSSINHIPDRDENIMFCIFRYAKKLLTHLLPYCIVSNSNPGKHSMWLFRRVCNIGNEIIACGC